MEVGQKVRIKEGAFGSAPSPLEQSYIGQEGYLRNKDFQGVTGRWLVLVNTALVTLDEEDLEPVKEQEDKENYFDLPLLDRVGVALSGFPAVFAGGPFSGLIKNAAERERLIVTIAAIINTTPDEVIDFYSSHHFSLEFIEQAVRLGAKLDEEDIKRTMEERIDYGTLTRGNVSKQVDELVIKRFDPTPWTLEEGKEYAFVVTTPDGDRTPPIKAADCYINEGALFFDDENDVTIMIFAPGHWVKVERVEEGETDS